MGLKNPSTNWGHLRTFALIVSAHPRGIEWSHSNLKVLAKFGLCSNCSQKLDECSLSRAREIFATARMLGFSQKFRYRCKH